MHNIKFIRENPKAFDEAMVKRGLSPVSEQILSHDLDVRETQKELEALQQQANQYAKKIAELMAKGEKADDVIASSKEIKAKILSLKDKVSQAASEVSSELADELLYSLPNIADQDVPEGKSEDDNVEIRQWGKIEKFNFKPKHHNEIGETLGFMDFKQTAKISGSRFVTLSSTLALMERALANFMLDVHTQEFGYQELSPPLLVREESMLGAGQLPKFADEAFCTTNGYWLIPTSEVSLVNMVQDTILDYNELPLRFVAHTPCFRSEAGAAGKDTKGMIRQHQFSKVELVSITEPALSDEEHERMTSCAEEILKRLELPYRVLMLCSQDMGFAAKRTYDLEVWLPAQDCYREVSSCSNCGDFQARRLKARYKNLDRNENVFVHSLNGSGLAIGRTIVAIIENFQDADGNVTIPHVLRPYMHGLQSITLP